MKKLILSVLSIFSVSTANIVNYTVSGDSIYTDTQKLISQNQPILYYKNFSTNISVVPDVPVENTVGQLERIYTGWIDFRDSQNQNPFFDQNAINFRSVVQVPCSLINSIKSKISTLDIDASRNGIQVKLYTLNTDKGLWVENGYGVFISSPVSITSLSTPIENIGNLVTNESQICSNNAQNAYVLLEGKDTRYGWNALGYVVNIPTISCNISIKDDKNKGVSTLVEIITNNSCSNYASGYTNTNGQVSLELKKYCSNLSYKINYYDPYTGYVKSYDTSYQPGQSCNIEITIQDTSKCEIEGRVEDFFSQPLPGRHINIYTTDYKIHKWSYSDTNGSFNVKVPCEVGLDIYIDGTLSMKSNVNNSTEAYEKNDDGNKVVLYTYKLSNKNAVVWGYFDKRKIYKGKKLDIYVSGYDIEGDFPITYEVLLKNKSQVVKSVSGTLNNFGEYKVSSFDLLSINNEGYYDVYIKGVDRNRNLSEGEEIYIGKIYIYNRNLPPVIRGFYLSKTQTRIPIPVDVYIFVEDLEGDSVSGSLNYICYNKATTQVEVNDTINNVFSVIRNKLLSVDLTNYNISKSDVCTFKLTVSDGNSSVLEERFLEFINDPPTINIWTDVNYYSKSATPSFTVYSIVADDIGIQNCNWYINNVLKSTSCSNLTVNTADYSGLITITLSATDVKGVASSKSIQVEIGQ